MELKYSDQMNDVKYEYQEANYDESSILLEYRKTINEHIIKSSGYGAIAIIVILCYFLYSDNYLRNIGFLTPWRIIPILTALAILVLRKTALRNNHYLMFIGYNACLFACSIMMGAVMFLLFETDLKVSINGTVVAGFLIYVGTIGGVRIMFINYLPIIISVFIVYFYYRPPMSVMAEYENVVVLVIGCLIVSEIQERLRFTEFRSGKISEIEKEKSNSLLLNILPAEVAEELKRNGESKARAFDMVTVIFTDFKGFTQASEIFSANELVDELNYFFKGFDRIMEKYGIEKIKTIGDAYMAVGGLHNNAQEGAYMTTKAALEMQEFVLARKKLMESEGIQAFEMRVGLHSGPVVAGIVGFKKFQYDIWGDTVNTAARMESAGEIGKVNISQTTYQLIAGTNEFSFTNRGKIQVKGKGALNMYYVTA